MPSPTGSTLRVSLSISQNQTATPLQKETAPVHHTLYKLRSNHTSGLLVLPWSHHHKRPKMESALQALQPSRSVHTFLPVQITGAPTSGLLQQCVGPIFFLCHQSVGVGSEVWSATLYQTLVRSILTSASQFILALSEHKTVSTESNSVPQDHQGGINSPLVKVHTQSETSALPS